MNEVLKISLEMIKVIKDRRENFTQMNKNEYDDFIN